MNAPMIHTKPMGLTSKFFVDSSPEKWADTKKAGFETAELVFPPDMAEKPMLMEAEKRREHILCAGLSILSAHMPYGTAVDPSSAGTEQRRQAIALEKRVLDRVAAWHIPIAVMHASFEPIGDDERSTRLSIARDSIAEISAYAQKIGVTLAVEELPRTCLGNCAEEMLYLTDTGRSAGIAFDFNHLLKETHVHFIDCCAPYIATTHISDYDFADEKHWMPGVGKVDWPYVIGYLQSKGYTGQWMFETYEQRAVPGRLCTPYMIMEAWQALMRSAPGTAD
ncbi:MAG: sugar phosphate isomerase/epimerase [Clostridia bacterium]|nr:sugar phosphate isomerase/epimerase [Clostridia bacterium]